MLGGGILTGDLIVNPIFSSFIREPLYALQKEMQAEHCSSVSSI